MHKMCSDESKCAVMKGCLSSDKKVIRKFGWINKKNLVKISFRNWSPAFAIEMCSEEFSLKHALSSALSIGVNLGRSSLGVTGQNIPAAGIYPGLKGLRLDYTRVYYGLGQFIPAQAKIYPHDINHDINSDERYTHELFNFSTSY